MGENKWWLLFIVIYGVQLVLAMFKVIDAPLIDLCVVFSVVLLLFFLNLKFKFGKAVPIGIGLGSLFHIIGLYHIIPYNPGYVGTLYGWAALGYHYDWIVHAFAILFYSIAVCSMLYPYLEKGLKSRMLIFIVLLFFMMGLGAFNEMMEYVGFDVLGYGRGFLEFGAGDSSPVGGPWENSSMDMISNLLGGIIGIGGFLFFKKKELT
ncbi:hypothetical protein KY332_03275 [Candidatus Woesearchaeota archaeon]|nr:hypothetical protein [Candidatus Woesearchaeota archaeon]